MQYSSVRFLLEGYSCLLNCDFQKVLCEPSSSKAIVCCQIGILMISKRGLTHAIDRCPSAYEIENDTVVNTPHAEKEKTKNSGQS